MKKKIQKPAAAKPVRDKSVKPKVAKLIDIFAAPKK